MTNTQKKLRPNNKDLVRYKNSKPGKVINTKQVGKQQYTLVRWTNYPYSGNHKTNQSFYEYWCNNKHVTLHKKFKEPNILVRGLEYLLTLIRKYNDNSNSRKNRKW